MPAMTVRVLDVLVVGCLAAAATTSFMSVAAAAAAAAAVVAARLRFQAV